MTMEELQALLEDPENLKKIGSAPLPVRIGAIVLICILVAVLGYVFLIKDKIAERDTAVRQEATLKQEFESKQKKASNLNAYEVQLEEMKRTFGSMLKSLPDKAEVESLLVEISRAGSANNLKINQFQPTGERPKEFYAEYPISMAVEGTYGELTGFVSSVASLQRIVTLHNIDIQPQQDSDEVMVNLTAKTYRYLSDE